MNRWTGRGVRRGGAVSALVLAASVALLATLNAGRIPPAPLEHTFGSPEALAEAVMEAIAAGDLASLRALALTEEEFRHDVWPELPVARPERNVPFEFVWEMLEQNSTGHLRQTASVFGGQPLDLVRVEFGAPATTYSDVTVHRNTQLVVRTPDGAEKMVRMFGSAIEKNGGWKVFSYVVDD